MSSNQPPSQGQQNPFSSFESKSGETVAGQSQVGGAAASGLAPSLFGGGSIPQNNTNTAAKASPFGSGGFSLDQNSTPGAQKSTPAAPSGSTFAAGANKTGSIFGGTINPTTPSAAPKTLFGGASGAAPPAGGLFGSAGGNKPLQATSTEGNGVPGDARSSGPNIFGSTQLKAPSGGLFGGTGTGETPTAATSSQPSLSIFGAANKQGSSGPPPASGAGPSNTTFGASNPLFGNASSSTPATTTQPSPFGTFGAKAPDASSAAETSTPAPAGGQSSIFGGVNAAGKPGTPVPSASAPLSQPSLFSLPNKPETTPNAKGPSLFSGFAAPLGSKDASKSGEKNASSATATDAAKDPSKEPGLNKDSPAPSPFTGFNLGGIKDVGPKPSTISASTTTAPPAATATAPPVTSVPAPSTLRGKTVEDIVNRWATELETHTREFSQFAKEVAVWDRTLIENGNYISALYATVLAAESTQASLDQSLDHVEQQQRQLAATLDQYEKSTSEILHGPGGIMTSTEGLGLADSERDKSYALAANLYTQLDDLSRSLTQMVESINNLNIAPGTSHGPDDASQEDAISTITSILNAHLSSLQWIDNSLNAMEGKIREFERKIKDSSARGSRTEGKRRSYGLGSSIV